MLLHFWECFVLLPSMSVHNAVTCCRAAYGWVPNLHYLAMQYLWFLNVLTVWMVAGSGFNLESILVDLSVSCHVYNM